MAPGYDLEVKATLDQKVYKEKLDSLVAYTATAGRKMQTSLGVRPDIDTKRAEAAISKLDARKLKNKDLDVDADTTKAAAEVDALVKTASAKEINIKADVNTASASIQGLATQLTTASRAAEQVASRLGTIGIVAGGAGLAVAGLVTALVGGVGIAAASTIEQTQVSLQALIGDSTKANSLLKDFKTEADISPFELKDYAVTAAKFAAATDDVEEIKKRTLQAANASAQYGGDIQLVGKALADVSNKGKLAGQEVIQFANAGIPIQGMVAKFLLLNGTIEKMPLDKAIQEVTKLQEEGKITADVVRGAIDNALDPAIAEKFAKTLKGRMSTLKDAFKNAAASFVGVDISSFTGETIVNPGGFYDTLAKSVTNLSDTFNSASFKKPLEEAGTALGTAFAGLAEHLPFIIELLGQFVGICATIIAQMITLGTQFLTAFGPQIQDAMRFAAEHAKTIALVLGGLVAGGVILKIGGALLGIVTPLFNLLPIVFSVASGITSAISSIITAFQFMALTAKVTGASLTSVIIGVIAPFALAGIAIAAIGVALVKNKDLMATFVESLKNIGTALKPLLDALKSIGEGLIKFLEPIGKVLVPILNGFLILLSPIIALLGGIVKIVAAIFQAASPILGVLVQIGLLINPITLPFVALGVILSKFQPEIEAFTEGMIEFIEYIADAIKSTSDFFSGLADTVSGAASKIPFIGDAFKDSGEEADKAKEKSTEFTEALKKGAEEAAARVDAMATAIKDSFKIDISKLGLNPGDAITPDTQSIANSLSDQNREMRTGLANTAKLVEAGFGPLVELAQQTGGVMGTNMINQFAAEIETNPAALEALKKQLTDIKLAEIEAAAEAQRLALLNEQTRQKKLRDDAAAAAAAAPKPTFGPTPNGPSGNSITTPSGAANVISTLKDALKNPAVILNTEAQASAQAAAVSVEAAYTSAFKAIKLDKGLEESLKNFKTTINKSVGAAIVIDASVTTAIIGFIGNVSKGISGGLTAVFILNNPFKRIKETVVGVFSDLSTQVAGFIVAFLALSTPMYNAAEKLGLAISEGITAGLSGGLGGGALGTTIYRALADSFNRVALQVEIAIAIMRAKLLLASIGGAKITIPQVDFPRLASGTNNWQGGPATINERGPENVILPRGSKVIPAHKSNQESPTVINNYNSTINGVSFEQAAAEWDAKIRAQRREVFV